MVWKVKAVVDHLPVIRELTHQSLQGTHGVEVVVRTIKLQVKFIEESHLTMRYNIALTQPASMIPQ